MSWLSTQRGPGAYWVRSEDGHTYLAVVWPKGHGVTCVGADGNVSTHHAQNMPWAKQWRLIEQPE